MNTSDHHTDNDKPTMGHDPGEQGDFASGQDDEGQHAEQAVDHTEEHTVDHDADDDDSDDDAHANEPRTDAAAPPAQGPAA